MDDEFVAVCSKKKENMYVRIILISTDIYIYIYVFLAIAIIKLINTSKAGLPAAS